MPEKKSLHNGWIIFVLAISLISSFPCRAELANKSGEAKNNFLQLDNEEKSPLEKVLEEENSNSADANAEPMTVLKGSATRVLDRKDKLSISLMTILSSEFSTEGDLVEGKIIVKPGEQNNPSLEALKGSRVKGHIVEVRPSRGAGRAGYVRVVFDTLQIKSGKEFPIKAELTTESFKGQEAAKMILYDAKLVTLGALWGTYNSLKWAPVAAVYTNGLSVAVSAGVGASIGLIGAFRRQGDTKTFFPSEKSTVKLQESLSLDQDVINEAALANKTLTNEIVGLRLDLLEANILQSREYENLLSIKVNIKNQTDYSIYPCDLMLIPKDGSDPLMADLRISGSMLLNSVKKGEDATITLLFPMNERKSEPKDYTLALMDPLEKKLLAQVSLDKVRAD